MKYENKLVQQQIFNLRWNASFSDDSMLKIF